MKPNLISGCLLTSVALGEQFKVYLNTEDIGGDSIKKGTGSNPLVIHIDKQSASSALIDTLSHSSNIIFADLPNVPEFVKASANKIEHQMIGSTTWKHKDDKKEESDNDKENEDEQKGDDQKGDKDKDKYKSKTTCLSSTSTSTVTTTIQIPKSSKSTTLVTKTKVTESKKAKPTEKPEEDEKETNDEYDKGKDKKKDKDFDDDDDDKLDDEFDDNDIKKEKGHKGKPVGNLPEDEEELTIPEENEKNYENSGTMLMNGQWLSCAALLGASVVALL